MISFTADTLRNRTKGTSSLCGESDCSRTPDCTDSKPQRQTRRAAARSTQHTQHTQHAAPDLGEELVAEVAFDALGDPGPAACSDLKPQIGHNIGCQAPNQPPITMVNKGTRHSVSMGWIGAENAREMVQRWRRSDRTSASRYPFTVLEPAFPIRL